MRMHAHKKTAPSAVDIHKRQIQNAAFHKNRHCLASCERRSAADEVAGMAIGGFRLAGRDLLAAGLPRQFLGGYFAIAVHQYDQGLGFFVLHDQCLYHGMFIYIQALC